MPLYNFGSLAAGLPDPSRRMASSVVMDPVSAQAAYLADWQRRSDAAQPVWVEGGGGGGGGDNSFAASHWNSAGWSPAAATQAIANGASPEAVASYGNPWANASDDSGPSGYFDDSARRALDAEKAKQLAGFGAQIWNQQAQQNAYTTSGGGSYLGGNINGSYATPQTGLDPNGPIAGMMNQPGTTGLGFGGPGGSTSQAGFGFTQGMMGQQPQGWGGPFTNRNPWAAS